jgi:Protein of unknown function (DUF1549)/Protein of unknown function (DUF1553)/Planctomycete cytochrome C
MAKIVNITKVFPFAMCCLTVSKGPAYPLTIFVGCFHMRIIALLLACCVLPSQTFAENPAGKAEFDPLHAEKMKAGMELFSAKVRAVFIEKCLHCHGGEEVESGFDLATRKSLMRGGSKGAAIVPGKSHESRLVALITHNEDPHMPEGDDKLPANDIAAIKQWIDLGAPYNDPLVENPRDPDAWTTRTIGNNARDHWAFQPLQKTVPPSVKQQAWVKTPIDAFILAKLEEKNIAPSPTVDKRHLIRRIYFDLIGLPPTAAEMEAFEKNESPTAYSDLVDNLLNRPQFGERWGRFWLDVARFAESHGFEQDYDRPHAYHFRDFVIEALNSDIPYTDFVKWQLAGDEFAPDNLLALKATGFLGAGVFPTQITANEVERTRYDALDDMAATTGTAFLGLTIGCARCHDHKFDPIPQADYYRFTAIFTTTVRSNVEVKLHPQQHAEALAKWNAQREKLAATVAKFEQTELPSHFAQWEKQQGSIVKQNTWNLLDITDMKSKGSATLAKQPDGSILANGKNPNFDTYTFVAKANLQGVTAIRLEALAHDSFVKKGPGRADNGNIALSDFKAVATLADGQSQPLQFKNATATFEQKPSLLVKNAIDNDPKSAWAVDPEFGKDHAAVFELAEPIQATGECTITFTLDFNNNHKHNIGRARLSTTTAPTPVSATEAPIPSNIVSLLQKPVEQRSEKESQLLYQWYKVQDADWQTANNPLQQHESAKPTPETVTVMLCSEGVTPIRHHTQGADFFNDYYFLKRGDSNQKQGLATPSFLQVLMNHADKEQKWYIKPPENSKLSYRRSALANWLTDTEYGAGQLLARVMVNRLWQGHFGQGLVATANDFGLQGKKPSHSELLDWLATDFIHNGWKMKRLHKPMVMSQTYQQASAMRDDCQKLDPLNEWQWRHTPRRLEAEAIRDSILYVSGDLDPRMYGAGSLDESHKRRSIYFTIKRSKLIPMMQLFDQPEPLVSVGNRPSTTIAPQALAFMNSPHVRGSAMSFANKLMPSMQQSFSEAVTLGYLSTLGRTPDALETAAATEFLTAQVQSYADQNLPNAQQLALADFCQVLFGLNEFVYVD